MGPLQTYFYLALLGLVTFVLALLFVFISVRSLRRWGRQERHRTALFWLTGAAVTLALLVFVVGTAAILYGFATYGGSGS